MREAIRHAHDCPCHVRSRPVQVPQPFYGSQVRFILLVVGWLLTCDLSPGSCITEALVAARIAGQMRWAAFHRFFSRAGWDPDRLGQTLFHLLEPLLSSAWIEVAVDDTVAQKRGPHVFGVSVHVDAILPIGLADIIERLPAIARQIASYDAIVRKTNRNGPTQVEHFRRRMRPVLGVISSSKSG